MLTAIASDVLTFIIMPALFAVFGGCLFVFYKGRKFMQGYPKNTSFPDYKPSLPKERFIRQRYNAKQVPNDLDAIVIGSGIGGLATASLLAQRGRKVLVLEQHDVIGGCMHSFQDHGYEFDSGVHYVGRMGDLLSSSRLLMDEVTEDRVDWHPMDDCYDEVVFDDGERYGYMKGRENWRKHMHDRFPKEKKAIDDFLVACDAAKATCDPYWISKVIPSIFLNLLENQLLGSFYKWNNKTAEEVINSLTDDPKLKAVLGYQYGDYGTPLSEASFIIHALVFTHYLEGAYFPVGGPLEISKVITEIVERSGGKCLVNARVAEIMTHNNRAVGVRMAKDDAVFTAPIIISTIGVTGTVKSLLKPSVAKSTGLMAKVDSLKLNVAHACLFVGLNKSNEELKLPNRNFWCNHCPKFEGCTDNGDDPFHMKFISFTSNKDPTWEQRWPGKTTVSVIGELSYDAVKDAEGDRVKHRERGYQIAKEEWSRHLLNCLKRVCPQITESEIDFYELGTGVTTNHYLGREKGESYGLAVDRDRFRAKWLRPETPIKNLYLAGHDVASVGFTGALSSAMLTCSVILGGFLGKDLEKKHAARVAAMQRLAKEK